MRATAASLASHEKSAEVGNSIDCCSDNPGLDHPGMVSDRDPQDVQGFVGMTKIWKFV